MNEVEVKRDSNKQLLDEVLVLFLIRNGQVRGIGLG